MAEPSHPVVVIGAGLSGLMAGVQAAQRGRALVLERQGRACLKFLESGMGAAPLSNSALDVSRFHGRHARFASDAINAFGVTELRAWFDGRGAALADAEHYGQIVARDGASMAVNALLDALQESGGELRLDADVVAVTRAPSGFQVALGGGQVLSASRVVLAAGARNKPHLGGINGGELAASLGHSVSAFTPAQVALQVSEEWIALLDGLSMDVRLRLVSAQRGVQERVGSMLFTPAGVSGEVVFNMSGEAALRLVRGQALSLEVNFFPGLARHEVEQWLYRTLGESTRQRPVDALDRMLPARLAEVFLRRLRVKPHARCMDLEQREREGLLQSMLATRLSITGTAGFDAAESARGGVSVREINPRTFESRLVPGLCVVGGVLDVSADWGGFEQHFALASGYLAGRHEVDS